MPRRRVTCQRSYLLLGLLAVACGLLVVISSSGNVTRETSPPRIEEPIDSATTLPASPQLRGEDLPSSSSYPSSTSTVILAPGELDATLREDASHQGTAIELEDNPRALDAALLEGVASEVKEAAGKEPELQIDTGEELEGEEEHEEKIEQHDPLSNTSSGRGSCAGPMKKIEHLPPQDAKSLRDKIKNETLEWGYYEAHSLQWHGLAGKRVLDVGMGQGPICVVAISKGIAKYTGLDPALCINQPAKTRNKRVKRTPAKAQCQQTLDAPECREHGKKCRAYLTCEEKQKQKYKLFPYTGLEMMRAYEGKIVLLPGTFETLRDTGLLQVGMFDVATLWSVTEHLPDNHLVLRGIFEWLKPGQRLLLSHHNYYSYDGHHGVPQTPANFNPKNVAHKETGHWRHLDSSSATIFNKPSLNRIRLGDLIALVDVYFICSWNSLTTQGATAVLKGIFAPLKRRGFVMRELLVSRWNAACERREVELQASWLKDAIFYHPPTDGSYKARLLPDPLINGLKAYTPPGREALTQLVPKI